MNKKVNMQSFNLLLGPVLFAISFVGLAGIFGKDGAAAIGIAIWMIVWWTTAAASIAVTSMVPVVINAFIPIIPMSSALSQFSSETIVMLFGANLLTLAWGPTGLGNRLALGALRIVGPSVRQQMVVWFVVTGIFSALLPNTAVATMFMPVAIAMLVFLGHENIAKSDLAPPILLAICYGSVLGGGMTPLGGGMNPMAIAIIQDYTGQEFMYTEWIFRMVPYVVLVSIFVIIAMIAMPLKIKKIEGTKEYFKSQYNELGTIKRGEGICLILFITALVLMFTRSYYAAILPNFTTGLSLLFLGFITFFIKDENDKPIMTWEYASHNAMWGLLFLIAGGAVMANMLTATGAVAVVAELVKGMSLTGGMMTIFIFTFISYNLAEFTAQTTASTLCIPLVLSVTAAFGLLPTPYIFITCMAFSGSFLVPAGIRAIAMGYGLQVGDILKRGSVVYVVFLAATTVIGYLLMEYWPYFSQLPGIPIQ
ncbi:hypothetical protein AN639_02015 [Candidatus Epulonipiscium fishelsonii]|uniref:Uncharacterized protein n=1 Tax=Candidatus Epulonipiscium fishelsonii TaxID=77094 RepID=A0ACC8X8Q1_9FIRM|nr:hypothetical protein AN396_10975 [Epulopiscium sp. SCG-B11WGA-EpuloA1]ONI38980.1 hypothetical protein AN639_02015 [Epulopiscium sp. SCG-B05WGA-EpuloA1]